jgi:hypothetical protein
VTVLLAQPQRHWECGACDHTHVSQGTPGHVMHNCAGMHGLSVPMVPAGTRCKVTAVEREDYVGNELVQTDARGRPVMAVVTTRDDGEDRVVYPPTAQATREDFA